MIYYGRVLVILKNNKKSLFARSGFQQIIIKGHQKKTAMTFETDAHQRPAKTKTFNPNPTRKKFLIPETRQEPEKKFFLNRNPTRTEKKIFFKLKPDPNPKKYFFSTRNLKNFYVTI